MSNGDNASELRAASDALWTHLERRHLRAGLLHGPDPSGRLNLRVGRFVKAALSELPWMDSWVSLQGAGYWVRWTAALARAEPDRADFRTAVEAACAAILARQRADGAWTFRDTGGTVATFESTWAALGLLEGARLLGEDRFAAGARRWLAYLVDTGAFQPFEAGLYVTYWSNATFPVPNNSAEVLWLLSELNAQAPEPRLDELMAGLLKFLLDVQLPSGELPYRVPTPSRAGRDHYLCYQYNAFEFLAVARYAQNTRSTAAEPLLENLARFLLSGITPAGACRTSCSMMYPEVDYYTAALGLALCRAEAVVGPRARQSAERLQHRLLGHQHADGSFGYSQRDYGLPFVRDQRSYPRTQAIIGYSLAALAALQDRPMSAGRSIEIAL